VIEAASPSISRAENWPRLQEIVQVLASTRLIICGRYFFPTGPMMMAYTCTRLAARSPFNDRCVYDTYTHKLIHTRPSMVKYTVYSTPRLVCRHLRHRPRETKAFDEHNSNKIYARLRPPPRLVCASTAQGPSAGARYVGIGTATYTWLSLARSLATRCSLPADPSYPTKYRNCHYTEPMPSYAIPNPQRASTVESIF
jgi:hypothetical protein